MSVGETLSDPATAWGRTAEQPNAAVRNVALRPFTIGLMSIGHGDGYRVVVCARGRRRLSGHTAIDRDRLGQAGADASLRVRRNCVTPIQGSQRITIELISDCGARRARHLAV